jgi:transposase-like protein
VARYSEERKEAVLSKLLPPYNMTVAELARQEGISEPTLYTWRNKAKSEGRPVPGRKATSRCIGQEHEDFGQCPPDRASQDMTECPG